MSDDKTTTRPVPDMERLLAQRRGWRREEWRDCFVALGLIAFLVWAALS